MRSGGGDKRKRVACSRGFSTEKMIYIVCVAGGAAGPGPLSQADPVHCRYGRVLLLIQRRRSAVGISYRSYSASPPKRPDIFIEARGAHTNVKLIITTQTIYGALTFNEAGPRGEGRAPCSFAQSQSVMILYQLMQPIASRYDIVGGRRWLQAAVFPRWAGGLMIFCYDYNRVRVISSNRKLLLVNVCFNLWFMIFLIYLNNRW